MRVVIDNAKLRAHRSCRAPYTVDCPWWNTKEQALIYEDWDQAVLHYLTIRKNGAEQLEWLVKHGLVPMTEEQLESAKKKYGVSNG